MRLGRSSCNKLQQRGNKLRYCATCIALIYTRNKIISDRSFELFFVFSRAEHTRLVPANSSTVLASGRRVGWIVETFQLHESHLHPQLGYRWPGATRSLSNNITKSRGWRWDQGSGELSATGYLQIESFSL